MMDKTQTETVFALLAAIRAKCEPGMYVAQGIPEIERLVHAAESVLCNLPIEDERKAEPCA